MRDGIYKVHFEGRGVKGFNIACLSDGCFTGCDQSHDTSGHYSEEGSRFTADFVMRRHARPENFVEIANLDVITVHVSGICGASCGAFEAEIAEKPELPVTAKFQWVCDI